MLHKNKGEKNARIYVHNIECIYTLPAQRLQNNTNLTKISFSSTFQISKNIITAPFKSDYILLNSELNSFHSGDGDIIKRIFVMREL